MAQVAILQIRVVDGDAGVHAPGERSARPLTVEVTDETGRPVVGAAVSFHLPEDGPSGSFANGLRTDVVTTDDLGRATLRSLQVNRIPGRFQIRIIASKEQARAGIVSSQYIGGPEGATGTLAPSAPVRHASRNHGHAKWIAILAAAGGGAAAGLAAGRSHRSSPATPAPTAAPATIGAPSITVGKP